MTRIVPACVRPTRVLASRLRRPLTLLLLALAATPVASQPSTAPAFPTQPVRLIVSFSPGGSVDATARPLAQALTARWNQPVVVENKPGADGNIAAELAARASPDGHTLLVTSNAISITPALRKLPFDPLNDLLPVARILSLPNFLVAHPSLPADSVGAVIDLARQRPGELLFASSGIGTTPFMGMALLMNMSGVKMTHVPYKGTAPAVMGALANETSLMFGDLNTLMPHIRAGKLKALGVSSAQRSELAPEIPTLAESGLPGFATATWVGVFAPAGTPAALVSRIHRDIDAVIRSDDFRGRVSAMGAQLDADDPAAFATVMRQDIERWTEVVRTQDIK